MKIKKSTLIACFIIVLFILVIKIIGWLMPAKGQPNNWPVYGPGYHEETQTDRIEHKIDKLEKEIKYR